MKITITSCCILLLCLPISLFAQEPPIRVEKFIWDRYLENWIVDEVSIFDYHSNGQVSSESQFSGTFTIPHTMINYEYDNQDRLVLQEEYDYGNLGDPEFKIKSNEYIYEGDLLKERINLIKKYADENVINNVLAYRYLSEHNEEDCLISQSTFSGHSSIIIPNPDWNPTFNTTWFIGDNQCASDSIIRISGDITNANNQEIIEKTINQFNEKGQLVNKVYYNIEIGDDGLTFEKEENYKYNEQGQLIQLETNNPDIGSSSHTRLSYIYDDRGNVLEELLEAESNDNWRLRQEIFYNYTPYDELTYYWKAFYSTNGSIRYTETRSEYNAKQQLIRRSSRHHRTQLDLTQQLIEWEEKWSYRCDGLLEEYIKRDITVYYADIFFDPVEEIHEKTRYSYASSSPCEELVVPNEDQVIYPNPAQDYIRVKDELLIEPLTRIEVYNMNGFLVDWEYNYFSLHQQFDIETLPPGTYWLRLIGEEETHNYKFIKMQ